MKKPHIIIIEDCDMMRQFLSTYLSGTATIHAYDRGYDALQSLSLENFPDVIILDLNLPDAHGLEILRQLKSMKLLDRINVIILSGEDKANSRISCLSEGASDYLVKPFHPRELKLRIQNVIGSPKSINAA